MLVELSRAQDTEAGYGTTTVMAVKRVRCIACRMCWETSGVTVHEKENEDPPLPFFLISVALTNANITFTQVVWLNMFISATMVALNLYRN